MAPVGGADGPILAQRRAVCQDRAAPAPASSSAEPTTIAAKVRPNWSPPSKSWRGRCSAGAHAGIARSSSAPSSIRSRQACQLTSTYTSCRQRRHPQDPVDPRRAREAPALPPALHPNGTLRLGRSLCRLGQSALALPSLDRRAANRAYFHRLPHSAAA